MPVHVPSALCSQIDLYYDNLEIYLQGDIDGLFYRLLSSTRSCINIVTESKTNRWTILSYKLQVTTLDVK